MKTLILTLLSTISMSAYAEGGASGAGGGGTAVILPDDTVVLADPYVVKNGDDDLGTRIELAPQIQEELKRATRFMAAYSLVYLNKIEKNQFSENIFGKDIEYRVVNSIPEFCPYTKPRLNGLPTGAQVVPLACTKGKYTWIVKDLFAKMKVREQAKLIMHERLRNTSTVGNDVLADRLISAIIEGVEVSLRIFNEQINGKRPELSSAEVASMQTLVATLRKNSIFGGDERPVLNPEPKLSISRQGGGMYFEGATIHAKAYLSIGSVMGPKSSLADGAELIDTDLACAVAVCALQKNSRIVESYFDVQANSQIELDEGSMIAYSRLASLATVRLAKRTAIENTVFVPQIDMSGGLYRDTTVPRVHLVLEGKSEIKNQAFGFLFRHTDTGGYFTLGKFSAATVGVIAAFPVGGWALLGAMVAEHSRRTVISSRPAGSFRLKLTDISMTDRDSHCRSGRNYFRDVWGYTSKMEGLRELERGCLSKKWRVQALDKEVEFYRTNRRK